MTRHDHDRIVSTTDPEYHTHDGTCVFKMELDSARAEVKILKDALTQVRSFFAKVHLNDLPRPLFVEACEIDEMAEKAIAEVSNVLKETKP
jgi:hypothetical protein